MGFRQPGALPSTQSSGASPDALTALYTAHYRRLVGLAALLLDDTGSAEEVVQDAYVSLYRGWRRIRDADKAEAYVRQAVVNGARSRLRRRQVAARHPEETAADVAAADLGVVDRLTVLGALRSLPARQREVLVLRYYGDLSEAQIAAAIGISAGAVKSHASRGLAALRPHLEEQS